MKYKTIKISELNKNLSLNPHDYIQTKTSKNETWKTIEYWNNTEPIFNNIIMEIIENLESLYNN